MNRRRFLGLAAAVAVAPAVAPLTSPSVEAVAAMEPAARNLTMTLTEYAGFKSTFSEPYPVHADMAHAVRCGVYSEAERDAILATALQAERDKLTAEIERLLDGIGPDDTFIHTDDLAVFDVTEGYDLETLPTHVTRPPIILQKFGRTLAFTYE